MLHVMKVTDDTDLLVGEYVLGTLEIEERLKLEGIAEREPTVAAALMVWERRLAPLHELIAPVEPPAGIWATIAARLDETDQDDRERDPGFFEVFRELVVSHRVDSAMALVARLRRWRSIAIVSIVLGAVVTAFLTAKLIEPHDAPPVPLISVLRADALTQPFIVAIDAAAGTLTVRSVPAATADDRSYAFWLLRGESPPLALGRLRGAGVLKPEGLADIDRASLREAALAASIEPADAPANKPTMPLVYRGGFE
jgi:anti-sigma-K factor RskA